MKRRDFIKKLPIVAGAPVVLNSMPFQAMAGNNVLQQLAATSTNDKVLVLIQLHGGNDGLNTIIPISQYADYYNLRPNVAIPSKGSRGYIPIDHTLEESQQAGFHPDAVGFKEMYDSARMAVVQGVAYENINGSHFRSRDIWFMGGDYDENLSSGWIGRYLNHAYPGYHENYPNAEMPDPLGLEIGNGVSLAFHRANGIPTAISINRNPDAFYEAISKVGCEPPQELQNTHYGEELKWIMDIEEMTNEYAKRLNDIYLKGGETQVNYPEVYPFQAPNGARGNGLARQLKMIAQLLAGGSKTKVFLARIGGFDTHADQVTADDPTMGGHAALLYHLSSSIKSFYDDLRTRGLEDKVLSMTFSEFGRRAYSNGSYGTDHGKAAPMFVFGKYVNPGIYGTNQDLNNLDGGSLSMQFDYRQVFSAAIVDWFQADSEAVEATGFSDWADQRLNLVNPNKITGAESGFVSKRYHLDDCYPNPVKNKVNFSFSLNNKGMARLELFSIKGDLIDTVFEGELMPGKFEFTYDASKLKTGQYVYKISSNGFEASKKLIKK